MGSDKDDEIDDETFEKLKKIYIELREFEKEESEKYFDRSLEKSRQTGILFSDLLDYGLENKEQFHTNAVRRISRKYGLEESGIENLYNTFKEHGW